MSIHFCYLKVPDTLIIRPHSLHDALPIYQGHVLGAQRVFLSAIQSLDKGPVLKRNAGRRCSRAVTQQLDQAVRLDRKSTRLNSSHVASSYAVFCLKKNTE